MNREADVRTWQADVGDIEALGLTPEEFEATSDLSLVGEVRKKGIVIYDADRPERTPAVVLRERRAEYESVEVASEAIRRHVLSTRTKK